MKKLIILFITVISLSGCINPDINEYHQSNLDNNWENILNFINF